MWRELIKGTSRNRGFSSSRIRNPPTVSPRTELTAPSQARQRVNKHLFSHALPRANIPTLHNLIAGFRNFQISILSAIIDLIERNMADIVHTIQRNTNFPIQVSRLHTRVSWSMTSSSFVRICWHNQFGEMFCFHFQGWRYYVIFDVDKTNEVEVTQWHT